MPRKLFGTDGIRGTANSWPMTADLALKVAMCAAGQLRRGSHRHRVVIGKDTRLSGYMIEPALTAGFVSMGFDVTIVGPIPTPGIAMLTRSLRCDLGVMISASHNPFEDNGIKLFGPDGYKLSDDVEAAIEARAAMENCAELAEPGKLGRTTRLEDVAGRYIEYVKATFPRGLRLDGLKIVVDCANGAAYRVGPAVLQELGADVVPLSVAPNGKNINDQCGAVSTVNMQAEVLRQQAHLGIAFDGDADRVIIADERGQKIDGDQILALIARSWKEQGSLRGGGVVATVMSNLGLEKFLESEGLQLHRTPVGDRYVVEAMRAQGFNVGGEQSGHIVLADYCTTGDGLVAALQVLAVVQQSGLTASEACTMFDPFPQILRNVRYDRAKIVDPLAHPAVKAAMAEAETALGRRGRLLVRKSGTEPLIRVMAEGEDRAQVDKIVKHLCETVNGACSEAHAAAAE
jgi:phosphoglucosamine mutase